MTNQGKLWKAYLDFFKELTFAYWDPWTKKIFLSQYLFIEILCAKMSRVNKAEAESQMYGTPLIYNIDFKKGSQQFSIK